MPFSQSTAEHTLHSAGLCVSTLFTLRFHSLSVNAVDINLPNFPVSQVLTSEWEYVILKAIASLITGRVHGLIDGSLMTPADHQCITDDLTERQNNALTLHGLFCTPNRGHASLTDCHGEQSVLFLNLPGYRELEIMVPAQLPIFVQLQIERSLGWAEHASCWCAAAAQSPLETGWTMFIPVGERRLPPTSDCNCMWQGSRWARPLTGIEFNFSSTNTTVFRTLNTNTSHITTALILQRLFPTTC